MLNPVDCYCQNGEVRPVTNNNFISDGCALNLYLSFIDWYYE